MKIIKERNKNVDFHCEIARDFIERNYKLIRIINILTKELMVN
jgi:hypothetical protein